MNRGSLRLIRADGEARGASMRPRFMNRGSLAALAGSETHCDRFNEAPIHESGKYRQRLPDLRRHFHASMRPRFMNRGSLEQTMGGATESEVLQ